MELQLMGIIWLIASIVLTSIIIYLFLNFLRQKYSFKRYGFRFWKSSYDVQLSATTLLCFTLFAIHCTIDTAYSLLSSITHSFNPLWCISSYLEFGWIAFSKLFLYMFFVVRLHKIFSNSTFSVSTCKLKALAFGVSIPIIAMSIVGFYQSYQAAEYIINIVQSKHSHNIPVDNIMDCSMLVDAHLPVITFYAQMIGTALYLFAELIYSIVILRLFLSRILLLSLSYDAIKTRLERQQSNSSMNRFAIMRANSTPMTPCTRQQDTTAPLERTQSHKPNLRPPKSETNNTKLTASERMEAKRSEMFLNLAIKTTNLIILAICTNYIILLKFALNTPMVILLVDALCNSLSIYLAYEFASHKYNRLFCLCHAICYACCARVCYCCCLPKIDNPELSLMELKSVSMEPKQNNMCVRNLTIKNSNTKSNSLYSGTKSLDTKSNSIYSNALSTTKSFESIQSNTVETVPDNVKS